MKKNKAPGNYCYYCKNKIVVTYNLNWYAVLNPSKKENKIIGYSCKPCVEGTEPPNLDGK